MPEENLVVLCQSAFEEFGLSCQDAQNSDQWKLKIKGGSGNPSLTGKWPLKRCVCVACPN